MAAMATILKFFFRILTQRYSTDQFQALQYGWTPPEDTTRGGWKCHMEKHIYLSTRYLGTKSDDTEFIQWH